MRFGSIADTCSAFRTKRMYSFPEIGHSYMTTPSTIGTSGSASYSGVKGFTIAVRPDHSTIRQLFPTTTIFACESNSVREFESFASLSISLSFASLAAAIRAVLIMCDVYSFRFAILPGSQHLVSSGFGVAGLSLNDETEACVAAGAGHPQLTFLGVTLRRMDCSVGLAISMDAAVAVLVDDCFEAIRLQT
jgi:hypothetical protein